MKIKNKNWWRATGIRCFRTFLLTITGVWTADTLITEINWKTTIISAISSTLYVFILCIVAGLPEVEQTIPTEVSPTIEDEEVIDTSEEDAKLQGNLLGELEEGDEE